MHHSHGKPSIRPESFALLFIPLPIAEFDQIPPFHADVPLPKPEPNEFPFVVRNWSLLAKPGPVPKLPKRLRVYIGSISASAPQLRQRVKRAYRRRHGGLHTTLWRV